ncbi:MAG: cytotoxic translational repressor of toxin-antitoxin stability system [Deltaproteobacteria bacterium]|nr:cytotoxic translational repressor of toxin-antitoxin stability system [Deltaproteobacteria bacterium]
MRWQVRLNRRVVKQLERLPAGIQERFKALALELRAVGPVQRHWPHYGKIQGADNCHHCHIKQGRPTYVAVWRVTGELSLEVTYVGTHEGADYPRFCRSLSAPPAAAGKD